MRLIDADELKKDIDGYDYSEEGYSDRMDFKFIYEVIDNQPTVEAKPVVTGEWMKSETGVYICSKCNNGYKNQPTCMGHPMFEYCPMCGAKMKGADMRGGKND